MQDLAKQVRAIYNQLSREEKRFLGGPPFTSEIKRELENYCNYVNEGIVRARTRIGFCNLNENSEVLGYQLTTIMNDANPNAYEKQFLGIKKPLDYVQLKTIFIHPAHRKEGYADGLLKFSIRIAQEEGKDWVCDILADNEAMKALLDKKDIVPVKEWQTKNKTMMLRFKKLY